MATLISGSNALTLGVSNDEVVTVYKNGTVDLGDEGIVIARYFRGDLQGTADYADRLSEEFRLTLQGDVTGSGTTDGASFTITTTVEHAAEADYATKTARAERAARASLADLANLANHAYTADKTGYAQTAENAKEAEHATDADHAETAETATSAISALTASRATIADKATVATTAETAGSAQTAEKATKAEYAAEAGQAISANRSLQSDWATTAGTAKLALKAQADADGNNIAETYARKDEINEISGAIRVITTEEVVPMAEMKAKFFYSLPITLRPGYREDEGSEGRINIVTSDEDVSATTMAYNTLYALPVTLRPGYSGSSGTQITPSITVQDDVDPDQLQDGQMVFTYDDTDDPFVDVDGDGNPD